MSSVYPSRPSGRSSHRRARSDPNYSYADPPYYTVQRIVPGRTPTPYPAGSHSPSQNSVEHIVDPGFLLTTIPPHEPPTPLPPRSPSPSPPRPGHRRNASRQGSIRVTQISGSVIRDIPQPARPAPIVPSSVVASWSQIPLAESGQSQSPPGAGVQRQGSHHSVHPQPPGSTINEVHLSHHNSTHRHHHRDPHHPRPSTTHHVAHSRPRPRPRDRPPSAASHRYAASLTQQQPVHAHGSATPSNASHGSLNGGAASQRHPRAPSPSPSSISQRHPGAGTHVPFGAPPEGSQSHTRAPSMDGSIVPQHSMHKLERMAPMPPLAANDIRRNRERPPLPANYDGQTQTRYVNMLLALDDISPFYNVLSAFFTWILLAGFVLLPGTFASWRNVPAGSPEGLILTVINHRTLFVIAFVCTGIGACGMIWLWWRWHGNYIWITNRLFIPGCLNSAAGLLSTLSNIYTEQQGVLGTTEKSALVVTGSLSVICGLLFVVYEYWLIRNLKLEHDMEVGVELPGSYGSGVLEEKRDDQDTVL